MFGQIRVWNEYIESVDAWKSSGQCGAGSELLNERRNVAKKRKQTTVSREVEVDESNCKAA